MLEVFCYSRHKVHDDRQEEIQPFLWVGVHRLWVQRNDTLNNKMVGTTPCSQSR